MAGRLPALLALNAVAVIWGSQHAIIKTLVWASLTSDAPITLINSLRFTLAAVTTATLSACRACRARAMGHGHAREARIGAAPRTGLLRAAAELALWLVAGFTLQLVGLQWTSASRSAFLLYLNAVLVPFIACLMGERNIGLRTWVTAFAAVSGVPQHACTCTAHAHAHAHGQHLCLCMRMHCTTRRACTAHVRHAPAHARRRPAQPWRRLLPRRRRRLRTLHRAPECALRRTRGRPPERGDARAERRSMHGHHARAGGCCGQPARPGHAGAPCRWWRGARAP